MSAKAKNKPKTLREEILQIVGAAKEPITTGEMYRQCTLAESMAAVSSLTQKMTLDKELFRITTETGRFAYQLGDGHAADAAADEPGRDDALIGSATSADVVLPDAPAPKPKANLQPKKLGLAASHIVWLIYESGARGMTSGELCDATAETSWLPADRTMRMRRISIILVSLNAYGLVMKQAQKRDAYFVFEASDGLDLSLIPKPRELGPDLAQRAKKSVARTPGTELRAPVTHAAPTQTPVDSVDTTLRPKRFTPTLLGHLQMRSEDHVDLVRDAIACRAPHAVLDLLTQAGAAMHAAERLLASTGARP